MKEVLFTADRRQVPCVDIETLRKLDRLATTDFGLSTAQLMESAGRNVTGLLLELWAAEGRNLRDTQVLFMIGPGRNGGNGLCAARHLANRGLQVSFLLSAPDAMTTDCSGQLPALRATDAIEANMGSLAHGQPDYIVDALHGCGLPEPDVAPATQLIQWCNHSSAPVLSLDLPAGFKSSNSDGVSRPVSNAGDAAQSTDSEFIRAQWVLALSLPNIALMDARIGRVFVGDAGIPEKVYHQAGVVTYDPPFESRYILPLTSD